MGLESLPAWLRTRGSNLRAKLSQKKRRAMFFEGLENRSLMAYDALNDTGITNENTTLSVSNPASGLLANDLGTPFAVTSFQATSAQGATVNVNSNGTFTYNPTGAPILQKMGAGETIVDTFTYTGRDNIFATDGLMRVQLLASSGPTNNTANWLNVWNAVDAGATGGTIAGYTINDNRQDTETQFNYADAGNFGGTLGINSINSDGPGGTGGFGGQTGDNYSIRAKTYLRFNTAGTYTIGLGSDDGRRISLTPAFPGTAPGYSGFTARGDQVNGSFNPGDSVIGFDGGTGHAWSVGTFTVAAGDVLRLDAFYYEGGGGDSGEIAIASGAQGTFNGSFALLAQGVQNIDVSSTGYTLDTATVSITVNGVNEAPTPAVDNYATNENTAFTTSANPTFGMNVEVYDGTDNTIGSADAARNSSVTGLPINPPAATGTLLTADLGTNTDGAFAGQAGVPAPGGGDSYAVFLTGWLKIDNTGNPGRQWTFGTFADDASRIRIDLDQDGVLEGSLNSVTGETVAFLGGCCAATLGTPVTINDGYYKFEAVFTEGGGGDYGEFFYAPGNPGFSNTNYALLGNASKGISAVRVLPNGLLFNDTDEEIGLGNPTQALVPTRVNGVLGLTGSSAMGASVTLNLDGSFTYNPNILGSAVQALATGQTAVDSFTYTVNDGDDNNPLETTQTVTITVTGLNDAPTAVNNTYTTNENTNLVANDIDVAPRNNIGDSLDGNTNNDGVLVNDIDPEPGDTLEVSAVQGLPLTGSLGTIGDGSQTITTPLGATVTMNDNGTFTYNPSTSTTLQRLGAGESLVDSFTYVAKDNHDTFTPGLKLEIYNQQGAETGYGSIAGADAVRNTVGRNPNTTGSVLLADLLGGGSFGVNNTPPGLGGDNYAAYLTGTLRVNTAGTYTFGTNSDDNSYIRINIGGTLTEVARQNGCCGVVTGTPVTLAAGDYDFVAMYTEGGGGDYGEFFYAPGSSPAFNTSTYALLGDSSQGIAAGTKTVSQGTGTVSITVNGVNEAPIANADNYATNENTSFSVTGFVSVPGIFLETYRDGSVNATIASADNARATLSPVATATVLVTDMYDPEGHFPAGNFADNIPFPGNTAGDDNNYAVFGTGVMRVLAAGTYTFGTSTDDNSRIRIDLDQDGVLEGSLNALGGGEAHPGGGTVAWQPGCCGNVFGTPVTLAAGDYKFEVVYSEGGGGSSGEFFYAPGSHGGFNAAFKLIGDASAGIQTFAVLTDPGAIGNDSDEEVDTGNVNQSITISAVNGVAGLTGTSTLGAQVTMTADGGFSYNPNIPGSAVQALAEGQVANDTFTYTITDNDPNGALTATGTVTITVTGRNDAPLAVNNSYTINEDTFLNANDADVAPRNGIGDSLDGNPANDGVLVNDIDVDATNTLTVVASSTTSANGVPVTVNPNGTFTYNPTAVPLMQALAAGESIQDTFTYTMSDLVYFNDGLFQVQMAESSGPGNTTANWLNVWNAIDGGVGPTGTVAGYNVTNYRQDTEVRFDYAGGGNFGGTFAVNSINGNGPGGGGGIGGQDADNYSIRGRTYLRFTTGGTFTLGLGSDDGRRIRMIPALPGSAPGFTGFSNAGGQNDGITNGGTVFGWSGGTGHNWSTATFTVAAGDIVLLDAFYYEGGGGDSGEIAIANGTFSGFTNTTDFSLLANGVHGIQLSSIGANLSTATVTVTVNGVNDNPVANDDGVYTTTENASFSVPAVTGVPGMNYAVYNSGSIVGTFASADAYRAGNPANQTGTILTADITGNNAGHYAPGNNPSAANGENYAVYLSGFLRVANSGLYTFGTFSDDNSRIRIDLNRNGNPNDDANIVTQGGCCGDVFGQVNLSAGDYAFEAMYTEGGGGDFGEFFYAPGAPGAWSAANYALIGDSSKGIASYITPPSGLLANDSDVDTTDILTATAGVFTTTQGATITISPNGSFTYNPSTSATLQALKSGQSAVDTYVYTLNDDSGGSDTGVITFRVAGISEIEDDTYSVTESNPGAGVSLTVPPTGVLTNDSLPGRSSGINVALASNGGVASQNSECCGGSAGRAIDGNTDGNFGNNSVTHTNGETNSWWQVALASTNTLNQIAVYNRTDCCGIRLSNFRVSVWNGDPNLPGSTQVWGKNFFPTGSVEQGTGFFIRGDAVGDIGGTLDGTSGNYVRIQLNGNNNENNGNLSLAEVQVFSQAPQGLEVTQGQATPVSGVVGTLGDGSATVTTSAGGTVVLSDNGSFTYDQLGLFNGLDDGETAVDSFTYRAVETPNLIPGMNVKVFRNTGGSVAAADAAIAGNAPSQTGIVDQLDFYGNGSNHFGYNHMVPGGSGDNYTVYASGTLRVLTAGTYTFGTFSDDASRIRLTIGGVSTTVALQTGCCGDVFGAPVALAAGDYEFDAFYTEGGGGDYGEFFYAPGSHASFNGAFRLIGDASGGIAAGRLAFGGLKTGGTVSTTGSSSAGAFAVSSGDLLQGLTPAVTGSALAGQEGTSNNAAILTNGAFGNAGQIDGGQDVAISDNTTLTYTLDTLAVPAGYDIAQINTFSGWQDAGRSNQNYIIRYSTVAAPNTFIDIGTVSYVSGANSARVAITSSSGLLASGVAKLQFAFGAQQNGYVGWRELDVIGAATPVSSGVSSAGAIGVSSNDLLQGLTAAVTGTALGGQEGTSSNAAVLTNGAFGNAGTIDGGQNVAISDNTTLTYTLDTAANPAGFDITQIDTYTGWQDAGRSNQNYTVSYSTVAAPNTFITLENVSYVSNANSARVSITSPNGLLAQGVAKIRFTFGAQQNGYVGWRELDVIGAPRTYATARITINGQNDAPVSGGDATAAGTEDATFNGSVPAATDVDIEPLTYVIVGATPAGVTFNSDGTFSVTPIAADQGLDVGETRVFTFTYAPNDGTVNGNVATVTVTINGVNDAPVSGGDASAAGTEDDVIINGNVPAGTDIDVEPLTYVVVGPTPAGVTFNSNGTFSVVPLAADQGLDVGESRVFTFTYAPNDGTTNGNVATVTVTINGLNDAPVANAGGPYNINIGQDLALNASGTVDVDIEPLTYKWDFDQNGTFDLTTSSATPTAPWNLLQTLTIPFGFGSHTINLVVNDGTVDSALVTAIVNVSNNFVFNPVADGVDDGWKLMLNSGGDRIEIRDTLTNTLLTSAPRAGTDQVIFTGTTDDETLTIDFTNTNPIPAVGGVVFNANGQQDSGDKLALQNGNATTITHNFVTENDGSVNVDGRVVTYTGLEPITDNLSATNRVFNFTSASSEAILLRNSLLPGFDLFLDSSPGGEQLDFVKPTASLTVNLPGGGVDTLTLQSAAITGNLSVVGAGADDVVNVTGAATLTGATAAASLTGVQTINFNGGTLTATTSVTLTASGAITTSSAGVDVSAASLIASAATGIDLDSDVTDLTATTSGAGNITVDEANGANVLNVAAANGDATVTSATGALNVTTVSATNVTLTATAGAITDANAAAVNVTATALNAAGATGADLDTTVTTLTAASTNAAIVIRETNGLAVNTVNAGTGAVTLTLAAGAITDGNAASLNVTGGLLTLTAPDGIDLDTEATSLTAATTNAPIVIREASAVTVNTLTAGTAMVTLLAGGAITDGNAAATNVTATSLLVTAVGGIALDTNIAQLAASNATTGNIALVDVDGLTVVTLGAVSGVANTGGNVTLTATDNAAAGDDLTVNSNVSSLTGSVTLNAGDNATIAANLSAFTTVAINIDANTVDPDAASGGALVVNAPVVISATGATFTGAGQGDTFTFAPQASTPISVLGAAPTANPGGDTLTLQTTLAMVPTLSIQPGQGSGLYTFTGFANVQYTSIENGGATTPYHINLDATATGIENIRLQRSNEAAIGANFEVYNSDTNALLYGGLIGNVLSFTFLGSANANTVTIDDANGLVDLAGAVPAPTGVGDNGNVAGAPEVFVRGNGGVDAVVFANTQDATDQIYGLGTGSAPGAQAGEVRTTNGPRVLSVYFDGVEGVVSNDASTPDTGALTIVGDANANVISLASSAGGTTVSATGYVPFTFAPRGFNNVTVNAGDGNDSVTLVSLNASESGLALTLNGEIGNDTLAVEAAPAGSTLALQGGVGNDTYNLGGAANLVDNILIPITIADTSGVDALVINDSSDASGDTVTITDSTVTGLSLAPAPNVTFSAIESLDVTTSGGDDTITTTLNGTNGLVSVNVRGANGDDDFFLSTADGMGTLTTLNLVGDAGSDDFGSATTPIRPLIGPATNIAVYGDSTAITTNPGGAVTDRLFLDMTTSSAGSTVNPLVIVDTVTGQATAANTRLFRFGGIDDIDLYDGGVLTDVAVGDLYVRATDQADNLVFYNEMGGVRVNHNGVVVNNALYAPTNRIVAYGRAGADYMEFNFTLGSALGADFRGEADNDTLIGGLGADTLVGGGGADILRGGESNDILYGEDQFLTSSPIAANVQRATGVVQPGTIAGNDNLQGGGGNDFLFGSGGDDVLAGGLGDDYVHGGDGNDILDSNGGNDILRGEAGNDLINGGAGIDIILGGDGDDRMFGRGNRDFMLAGLGADQLQDDDSAEDVSVSGGLSYDADNSFSPPGSPITGLNDNDVALQALMFTGGNAWSGAGTFAARVANLSSFNTMTNDGVMDIVIGTAATEDYLIVNAADWQLNTQGDTLLTL